MLKQTLNDPIVQLLIKHSNLTDIQFQTLYVDHVMYQMGLMRGNLHRYDDVRADRTDVSRGSFNRTLNQATKNIIRSIYTIFLLGYVGMFDDPSFEPFVETSSQIRSYLDQVKSVQKPAHEDYTRIVSTLGEELRTAIERLAGTRRLRDT